MLTVYLVFSHCKTICLHLESRNGKENASSEQFSAITWLMESVYKFLQENAIDDLGAKITLQTTRCILIEKGKRFILPSQVVLDLYEKDEIKPFLYGVPPEFGKFRELFEFFGCSGPSMQDPPTTPCSSRCCRRVVRIADFIQMKFAYALRL